MTVLPIAIHPAPSRTFAMVAAVCALLSFDVPATAAEAPVSDVPINFTADEVVHNRDLGTVTATGNVEVVHGPRTLYADSITYNERQGLIAASGSVRILEPSGDVVFADYMELTSDMRDGMIKSLRMLLADRSRMAGAEAKRVNGTRHEMERGVYSACEICQKDPSRPPLWQVKAVRVIHDADRQTVEYKDAWLEMAGIPIAYTPYFSHPDPTVKRRTGFLAPGIGSSTYFGTFVQAPFFWDLGPNQDMTLTPLITTNRGGGLGGEYRFLGMESEVKGKASAAYDNNYSTANGGTTDKLRGHIDMKGRLNLNDTWRTGLDVQRASDDTYMRQYRYQSLPLLTTRAYTEGFRGRNYLAANAYAFQDQRQGVAAGASPLVLPMVEYSHLGEPGAGGGRTRLNTSMLAFTRSEGADVRRLSFAPGWDLPYVGPAGDIYKLSLTLRGDLYHINNYRYSGRNDSFDGTAGRIHPEGSFEWRYPFVRRHGTVSELLEPIASVVVSPYTGTPIRIPNEDSREIEFDETNLFTAQRYPGLDRVDGGPRLNYGLRWGVFGDQGGNTTVLLGQSIRAHADDTYAAGTGLEDHLSDFVARVNVRPTKFLNLNYRTRLDKDDLSPVRSEASASLGSRSFLVGGSYYFFDRARNSEFPVHDQLSLFVNSQVARNWNVRFSSLQDLEANALRAISLVATYEDECFILNITGQRNFFYDRDLKPDDSIVAAVTFKTLGDSLGFQLF